MGLSFLSNPFCAIVGLKNEFPIFWCVLLYCKTKWKSSQVLSFPIGFEKPCGKGIREMALVAKAFSNIQPYFFLKLPFFFFFFGLLFFHFTIDSFGYHCYTYSCSALLPKRSISKVHLLLCTFILCLLSILTIYAHKAIFACCQRNQ